ncbi:MAG: type II toxin-antitoxin system VapC family toxin [Desulfobacterales bacterium]
MIPLTDLENAVSGKTVLIDSNIIIYLTDSVSPYSALSRRLFEMIEIGEVSALVSIVSVGEVMQGPLKRGLYQAALEVKDYLLNFPNLFCESITSKVLDIIGKDKRIQWSKLRMVDSLIIASALKNNVDRIVSNDDHFKKALPKELLISFA